MPSLIVEREIQLRNLFTSLAIQLLACAFYFSNKQSTALYNMDSDLFLALQSNILVVTGDRCLTVNHDGLCTSLVALNSCESIFIDGEQAVALCMTERNILWINNCRLFSFVRCCQSHTTNQFFQIKLIVIRVFRIFYQSDLIYINDVRIFTAASEFYAASLLSLGCCESKSSRKARRNQCHCEHCCESFSCNFSHPFCPP